MASENVAILSKNLVSDLEGLLLYIGKLPGMGPHHETLRLEILQKVRASVSGERLSLPVAVTPHGEQIDPPSAGMFILLGWDRVTLMLERSGYIDDKELVQSITMSNRGLRFELKEGTEG